MKAFILAAGLGTRLRPLTDGQPKVMVKVAGERILERTIRQLKAAGIDDLVVNTHYFPEVVTDYFGDGSNWGVKIQYSFEQEILGTAGGVKKAEEYLKNEKEFLVVYGDNVFNLDFGVLAAAPLQPEALGLIALFDRTKNSHSGIAGGVVEVKDGFVSGFYEGVERADLGLVNGGIYKFKPDIFKLIPEGKYYDFGKDVFPKILGKKLQSYILGPKEAVFGVDTMESLDRTNKYFKPDPNAPN